MRNLVLMSTMLFSSVAAAQAATPLAVDQKNDIRVLGRLNVNEASRDQLLTVPGLDPLAVTALLAQRQRAPLDDGALLGLPNEAAAHLKADGASDYRRIRPLPLQVLVASASL
jgi:DNA uptake protein ComE-like DNA-binding protein